MAVGHAPPGPRGGRGRLVMAAVVAGFVLAGHLPSLDAGLFLDDHAHFQGLRNSDWSFHSAVQASRLGFVGELMDLWGRPSAGLVFFRPIAFWIMKIEYTLVGWRPAPMHAMSLIWHFICAMLVGVLAMRCFGHRFWATVAASIMALHPGHTTTVYWIACQTELVSTALVLTGILAYSRCAGWGVWPPAGRSRPQAVHCPWFLPRTTGPAGPSPWESAVRVNRAAATAAGMVAVTCYALALGCREDAVLFPVVCWLGDRLCGSRRRRRIRWEHAAMAGVLAGYLVLRWAVLGGLSTHGRPYSWAILDPGFPAFAVEKVVYYTLGLFTCVPVVPMGGQAYFATRPWVFFGSFFFTGVILAAVWWAYRFRTALLWPVVWMTCFLAPVVPVFASSHHLYLPGAGAALLITATLGVLGQLRDPAHAAMSRARRVACTVALTLCALGLGLLTAASGTVFRLGTLSEDLLIEDVLSRGRPLRDGDHLFFVNMPILAYCAIPAIENQTGLRNLHGHVLTFSPPLVRMESPGELEVLDAHRLYVRSPEGQQYFEGITGRTVLEAMGFTRMPAAEDVIDAGSFTVTPLAADARGIRELVFTFDEELDSPGYHFFFGSPRFLAYPVDVSSRQGKPAAASQPGSVAGP